MADPPQPADIPLAMPAFVDVDLPCFFCGYNLRSLGLTAICPECGHPVQESIRHGWLGYADPAWLHKLRTGVTIPLWTILAAVVLWIAMTVWMLSITIPAANAGSTQSLNIEVLMPVQIALGLGFAVAALVSVWLLTAPEPVAGKGLQRSPLAAWTRRLTAASYGVGIVFMGVMWIWAPVGFGSPPFGFGELDTVFGILYIAVSTLNGVACSASFLLLLIHLRRLARRHYRRGLGRLMTFLIWGSVALGGAGLLFVIGVAGTAASAASSFMVTTAPAPFTFTMTSPTSPALPSSPRSAAKPILDATEDETQDDEAPEAFEPESDPTNLAGSTTQPAATPLTPTSMPVGGPPPFPFGLGLATFVFGICLFQVLGFAWFVSGIVALFWFRVVLSRAIRENIHGPLPVA